MGRAGLAFANADADAVSAIDRVERVLVGQVVAEVDRDAIGERLVLQQLQRGAALVHANRLELQYLIAGLQLVAGNRSASVAAASCRRAS